MIKGNITESKIISYRKLIGGLSRDSRNLRAKVNELEIDLMECTRRYDELLRTCIDWRELAESLKGECIRLSYLRPTCRSCVNSIGIAQGDMILPWCVIMERYLNLDEDFCSWHDRNEVEDDK